MGEDFRLNYRLEYECSNDAEALCGEDVCPRAKSLDICGGKVLRCLVEKKDEIKDENCKREVFYFIKMEVCSARAAPETQPTVSRMPSSCADCRVPRL